MTAQITETAPAAAGATTYEVGTTVEVDPATLLLDKNIRQATPDKGLIASVKDVGVLEPAVAVLTTEGDLRVRYGARRTLAAIAAERTIHVYIAAREVDPTDEAMQNKADAERMIRQRDENTHRTGLTTGEEVKFVEDMALMGLTAGQIARRARIKKDDVETALAVAASPVAKAVLGRYEALTLDQSAVVAEFQDDEETVKALVAAAVKSPGDFAHIAQIARDDRAEAVYETRLAETLAAAGVRLLAKEDLPGTAARLADFKADKSAKEALSAETHAECPGHIAWLGNGWVWIDTDGNPAERDTPGCRDFYGPVPVYGCENPTQHGHVERWPSSQQAAKVKAADMTDQQREKAKAERRTVIENNKQWASAETVRREWVKSALASRKVAPKGTAAFLAAAIAADAYQIGNVAHGSYGLVNEWMGDRNKIAATASKATEGRALVLALVQVLASFESHLTKDSWRQDGTTNACGRYLRFIESCGYTLSDVEKFAISKRTA